MRYFLSLFLVLIAVSASAQEQQAGNAASTNAEETFQKLVDQCDDIDMLMLRARIRLEIGRADADAIEAMRKGMTEGFGLCAEGKVAEAKALMEATYANAKEANSIKFAEAEAASQATAAPKAEAAAEAPTEGDNTMLYVILAGIVVAAGAGYAFMNKSKKPSASE